MKNDWIFVEGSNVCNFRTVGVLLRDGKLLVQREQHGSDYALPGGHVKIGENSMESLVREYREETGAEIACKRLLWVEENFWTWNGRTTNSINFYYEIALAEGSDIPDHGEFVSQKDNCNVVLGWMPLAELSELTIYPTFLPEKIQDIKPYPEHFIRYD